MVKDLAEQTNALIKLGSKPSIALSDKPIKTNPRTVAQTAGLCYGLYFRVNLTMDCELAQKLVPFVRICKLCCNVYLIK